MPEFTYYVRPPRPTFAEDCSPDEAAIVGRHFNYLKEAFEQGVVTFVGRSTDLGPVGLCVFSADDEATAKQFLANDPAVAEGVFTGEIHPFRSILYPGIEG
jgi:uncharacterized protein YciI